MKTISLKAANALLNRKTLNTKNTKVVNDDRLTYMLLHGNMIAIIDSENKLKISNCGWFTNTTRDRLNALPGIHIYQKNYVWYLNGKQWNGELITIN